MVLVVVEVLEKGYVEELVTAAANVVMTVVVEVDVEEKAR